MTICRSLQLPDKRNHHHHDYHIIVTIFITIYIIPFWNILFQSHYHSFLISNHKTSGRKWVLIVFHSKKCRWCKKKFHCSCCSCYLCHSLCFHNILVIRSITSLTSTKRKEIYKRKPDFSSVCIHKEIQSYIQTPALTYIDVYTLKMLRNMYTRKHMQRNKNIPAITFLISFSQTTIHFRVHYSM